MARVFVKISNKNGFDGRKEIGGVVVESSNTFSYSTGSLQLIRTLWMLAWQPSTRSSACLAVRDAGASDLSSENLFSALHSFDLQRGSFSSQQLEASSRKSKYKAKPEPRVSDSLFASHNMSINFTKHWEAKDDFTSVIFLFSI